MQGGGEFTTPNNIVPPQAQAVEVNKSARQTEGKATNEQIALSQNCDKECHPLISIIVPCYNVEHYLPSCVDSLVGQKYRNIEIILVDDGSPDRCGEICDEYAHNDNRVKVIHKKNGGLVSARNAGFDAMNGDWHMYVDGDDSISLDMCSTLVEYIEKHPTIDIFFGSCVQELGDRTIVGKWEWPCKGNYQLYEGEECKELSRKTLIYKSGLPTACCKLINSRYAKKFGIRHDDRLRQGVEGVEFTLRAFFYARQAMYIKEYFYHYRYNPNSISKKIDERNTKYLTDCFDVISEDLDKFGERRAFLPSLYLRVVYVLIAIAMGTYFHPANTDNLVTKCRKYGNVIANNKLYSDAVKNVNMAGVDRYRKVAMYFIKFKMYFMLSPIAQAKQYYLKRGKFNY